VPASQPASLGSASVISIAAAAATAAAAIERERDAAFNTPARARARARTAAALTGAAVAAITTVTAAAAPVVSLGSVSRVGPTGPGGFRGARTSLAPPARPPSLSLLSPHAHLVVPSPHAASSFRRLVAQAVAQSDAFAAAGFAATGPAAAATPRARASVSLAVRPASARGLQTSGSVLAASARSGGDGLLSLLR